jgi:hypothetical protein
MQKNIVILGFSDDAQLERLRLVSGACRASRAHHVSIRTLIFHFFWPNCQTGLKV